LGAYLLFDQKDDQWLLTLNLRKGRDYMYSVTNSYMIAYAIVLTPIILVICGAILRKLKKKISKWLLIIGGSLIGLYALFFVFSLFANFIPMG
jgi:hypothetical protein